MSALAATAAETGQASKIHVAGVTKSFGEHRVLKGVDLDVGDGESLVLFGISGAGKSLLLRCIIGLMRPDNGSIVIDGQETAGLSGKAHAALMDRVSMLFQYSGLFDSLPVWENIVFQLTSHRKIGRKEAREIAIAKLIDVGLRPAVADLYPAEISGGMQKRVGIARAIASDPEILLLDEPTAGLDPIMSNRISALIVKLVRDTSATAISITSDMATARKIAHRTAMIHDGKIIWTGAPEQLDESGNPHVHQFVNQLAEGPIEMRVRAE